MKAVRGKYAAAFAKGVRVTVHGKNGDSVRRLRRLPNGVMEWSDLEAHDSPNAPGAGVPKGNGHIVRLDPDVAAVFPDSESVNDVLRPLAKLIHRRKRAG